MNTTSILIRTDPKVKEEAQKTANELGLSLSAVITGLLKEFVRKKTITFSGQEEVPNAKTRAILKQAEEDLKAGNTSPKFKTAEEFIEYLHKHSA